MMVVITGSRHWTDRRRILQRLMELPDDTILMHGDCKTGADPIADLCGRALGFTVQKFPAGWKWNRGTLLNPEAGPKRNREMLDRKPQLVIGFHRDIEKSKGTKDCLKEAARRGIDWELIST